MKGFIRVLEMILASIILLSSLSFFFSTYIKPSRWQEAELQLYGQDILKSLDEAGLLRRMIEEGNVSGLEETIRKVLPESVGFLIEIEGLPKESITIACNCTDLEKDRLQEMLHISSSVDQVMRFKGRKIKFIILDEGSLEEILKQDAEWDNIDIIVFFGLQNLTKYEERLNQFLSKDKALVLISNVDENIDDFYSRLFNLSVSSGDVNDENELYKTSILFRKLSDYFVNTPVRIKTHNNTGGSFYLQEKEYYINSFHNSSGDYAVFNNSYYEVGEIFYVNATAIKVMDVNATIGNETYVDIAIQNKSYTFIMRNFPNQNKVESNKKTILRTTDGFASMQVNFYITKFGKGRTLWIKEYDSKYSDINQIFKASLLWVGGERYILAKDYTFDAWYRKKVLSNVKEFVKVRYLVSGLTEFQPFFVNLILWYIY